MHTRESVIAICINIVIIMDIGLAHSPTLP
ncbi:Uncharacterised protein [Bordetella hinzii]|nr:hypothetical protein ACR54_03894 [Bordetella hinzii]SNV65325.1 Uncharacterised protein [Bordetella hinzii]